MAPRAPSPPRYPQRPELSRDHSRASKASVPSVSPSNEADDEQSGSDHDSYSTMGPQSRTREPYDGEDTRLTSTKELAGFYMYGWAAEVFVVCGVGSFIPITLEQLARERGVLLSDKTTPCSASFHVDPPGLNITSSLIGRSPKQEPGQCVVHILGLEVNTASFAMYTFSISVLIQALLIISMSGAADHGRFRKTFLLSFAFIGAIATMLFLPIVPSVYLLGALLAIIANTCFGASFVLLNSFLPLLVRHHPTVQYYPEDSADQSYSDEIPIEGSSSSSLREEARYSNELAGEETLLDGVIDSTTALLHHNRSTADLTIPNPRSPATASIELALSTKISSYGIGIGYIAALIVQTLSIVLIVSTSSTTFSLRLVLFVIGFWWFIFTFPTALWLRPRPGPPLALPPSTTRARAALAYFTYSWKALGRTVTHARRLKDVLLFLAAWFLLSDAIATTSGTAVLFAKTSLEMKPAALALINVIATASGVVGAFSWSRLSIWMRLRPSQTILACILLFETIPLYGLLGYIPAIQRLGVGGLQQPWEMYPLGAVYGFVLGGLSSYCRSLFGELIPPGFEAAFYALYAITDKGSSVFGPAIVGAITDRWGSIRPVCYSSPTPLSSGRTEAGG
ncbi:uncharacterized protein BDZ99DRAFT_467976 [Mytilinidion resinicola]|uniref:Autophagy-related protein n=1 Tax=Mytilinidion resinicola TaxID=574789 RepID=A0A6A6Y5Q9_9PEZI|nr:uncharacterized protein BDZ99DRAFT_467976 [Mytilinidion resinicola]KAF2803863.1 hypothetical protein BDZ99DRAFT_467976 [Mytilinidion resinicola]